MTFAGAHSYARANILRSNPRRFTRRDEPRLVGLSLRRRSLMGGPFGVTTGLAEAFGKNRVVNTPISEGTVMGLAIGAATAGLRPVVEIMFIDFITLAMDQLVNHAAKLHYMSGGQLKIPLTVRVQCGISGNMGAHHSQSLESWLAHVPGLKVVMPSNPADAKGLLKGRHSRRQPGGVYRASGSLLDAGEVPEGEHLVPIGKAAVAREGEDFDDRRYGEDAAHSSGSRRRAFQWYLRRSHRPADVSPLDIETIDSVKKTSRLIIVHEAVEQDGIGAEIVARVQQEALLPR